MRQYISTKLQGIESSVYHLAGLAALEQKTRVHRAHLHARKERTAAKSTVDTARQQFGKKSRQKSSAYHKTYKAA